MTDDTLRAALDDLYRVVVSEHGHDEKHEAVWPACLPVHIAMNRYRDALAASATDEGPDTEWDCQHVHCLNRLARPAVPATDEGRWKMPNVPCCGYKSLDVVRMNPYNGVVQCHNCGITYEPPRPAVPALDASAFVDTLTRFADRAHDNESYRTLVPEHVLRDAAAVIEDLRYQRAASKEPTDAP